MTYIEPRVEVYRVTACMMCVSTVEVTFTTDVDTTWDGTTDTEIYARQQPTDIWTEW